MQVKVRRVDNIVCMIVIGCRGEEVYDGCREGFYVCKYVEVSLYVGLYEDVEIYYRHVVSFCVVCSGVCVPKKRETRLFCIH